MAPAERSRLRQDPGLSPAIALRRDFGDLEVFRGLPLPAPPRALSLFSLPGASKALFVATLRERLRDRPFLVCVSEEGEVDDWLEDLALWSPERSGRPRPRVLPLPEEDEEGRPLAASLLARGNLLANLEPGEICIAELSALMAPVLEAGEEIRSLRLETGDEHDPRELVRLLVEGGFHPMPQVCRPGEVAQRGDVVDLFPHGAEEALRLEFWDDELESIRRFDPKTQRSIEECDGLRIPILRGAPARRPEGEDAPFPLDLFEGAVFVVEPARLEARMSRFTLHSGSTTPAVAAFRRGLSRLPAYGLSTLPVQDGIDLGCAPAHVPPAESTELKARILAAGRLEDRPLVVLRSRAEAERLLRLAREARGAGDPGLDAAVGSLSRGFRIPALGRTVLNHGEFFGTGVARRRYLRDRKKRAVPSKALGGFFDLREGDLVVHAIHGIGRFLGLERGSRGMAGGEEEHLRLGFQDDVQILVPASMIDLVQKYVGAGNEAPRLDKVGGRAFGRRKAQVARALQDMAAALLEIQVRRAESPGFACPEHDPLAEEFEAAFPFTDTPDQARTTKELLRDLRDPRPMDRLLCGDVGFGKTEIAMRAAFRMVSAGKQVAVLVPTTLLAEQHGRTFADRMASFPVRTAVLSRLQSPRERREVLEGIASGGIDILIGTHRILSKDVRFKDLGLLIVDEEQRFGVAQKEKVRRLKARLDVLTLTATPIPRTLHMALLGIKDISSLATPPPGRMEIRTKVVERSARVIRHAILEEIRRGGQIFFLHNRVHDLALIETELQNLVPEARIVTGHGQMPEKELLVNMRRFLAGDADLLLSTTIVESGLDIPRANTILVDHADRFGLAELHQLRGRVGRDVRQASCWLLIDPTRPLSPEAKSRLQAMERFSGLGAGFSLAMRDLEIRGAGNLLGPEQSGHIAAIGYDMYCRLLQAAVERNRDGTSAPSELPEEVVAAQVDVDLGVEAFIPPEIQPDPDLRIALLREMDEVTDPDSRERIASDLRDRFGRLPPPLERLLDLFLVKHLLAGQGMRSARFLPPGQCILQHAPGRGPRGGWLEAFADVRAVRPETTCLVLPPGVDRPEAVLAHLRDALSGARSGARLGGPGRPRRRRRPQKPEGPKA